HFRIVLAQHLGDRRRQRGLPMIDVPDRPNIHVRLAALEFLLRHFSFPSLKISRNQPGTKLWSGGRDLNPQPSPWKSETLPLSYPRSKTSPFSYPATTAKLWSLGPGLNR